MKNFALIFSFWLAGCSFFTSSGTRPADGQLSSSVAAERAKVISGVAYQLEFDLTQGESFAGQSVITFKMTSPKTITLDFFKGQVSSLTINGHEVKKVNYNDFFIELPSKFLRRGENVVAVKFVQKFSKNGVGLYRYVDPVDQGVYTYSDFEPYDANQMFPCFDQPDIKATFATTVTTPLNWEVISSTMEERKEQTTNNTIVWSFPESQRFSTYVYALHAGTYEKWESQVKTPNQVIPLRLFARKSLAKYVQLAEWFVPTQQGFNFFEDYFGTAYPYQKYDQIIVPDSNFGAMENVAAVTFNEDRFIHRGEKTKAERRSLTNTIFHEMAHMWFGNLVTMKWWNDLWLNESFATFMANEAMVGATQEFKDNWLNFFTNTKDNAYWTDGSVTTHPIEAPVHSTADAFANFDGITYGKGASVLKQLSYFLGIENFKKGLRLYFKKHANANTELKDFISAMTEASGLDLNNWQSQWLQTAGVNSIKIDFKCDGEIISEMTLRQTADSNHPFIRPHKTQFVILRDKGQKFVKDSTFLVEYDKEVTQISEAVGKPCPAVIYPNDQDYDYVKVALDEKTIATLLKGIARVEDSFVRTMLWYDLWQLVLNQQLDAVTFLQVVVDQGMNEPEMITQKFILNKVNFILKDYLPRGKEWEKQRSTWVKRFENITGDKLKESRDRQEWQKLWFDYYIGFAETSKPLRWLADLLKRGQDPSLVFDVDQDRRWVVLGKLAAFDYRQIENLLAQELQRDPSKRGQQKALMVEAIRPRISVKKTFFERVSQGVKAESLGNLKAIMASLFPRHQMDLQKQFVEDFYRNLKEFATADDSVFVENYAEYLVPQFCDEDSTQRIQNFVKAEKMPSFLSRILLVAAQENGRCTGIRKKILEAKTKT